MDPTTGDQPICQLGPRSSCNPRRFTMRTSERRTGRSMTYEHITASTQFVEANGIRFAHRRFGQEGGTPLLFMQHFRGGMDHWDPAVTDGFAKNRPVILFDNAGVASSSGETPDTIDAMAEHAADFVGALGISQIDLLGFSIGGYIAQTLTIRHPGLIRRLRSEEHTSELQSLAYLVCRLLLEKKKK